MIDILLGKIQANEEVRQNLIALRQELKTPEGKQWLAGAGEETKQELLKLLDHSDPKVRKNAVLILGEFRDSGMVEAILEAYKREETRFVRSDYLTALSGLDYRRYLPILHEQMEKLAGELGQEESQKHIHQEMSTIQKLLVQVEGVSKHTFLGLEKTREVILTMPAEVRTLAAQELKSYKRAATGLGLKVETNDISPLFQCRLFEDLLLPIPGGDQITGAPDLMGEKLALEILPILETLHKEPAPFYFRIALHSGMGLEERSSFTRKLSMGMEKVTEGKLRNSTSGYEWELGLWQKKDGSFYSAMKLCTIEDHRFSYRKKTVSTSLKPVTAARILKAAQPYLYMGDRVLDPFCKTGILLLERGFQSRVNHACGVDVFGEAIAGAKDNTPKEWSQYYWVQRDFSSFTHDEPFEEIITELPSRGKLSREEHQALYQEFFDRAKNFLTQGGVMVLYSDETGFIHKQLRLHKEYVLLDQYCLNKRQERNVYIIRTKGIE